MTLLSDKTINLQAMTDLAAYDASRERYTFSLTKTKVMVINCPNKAWSESSSVWKLGDNPITVSNSEVHLGITRTSDGKASSTVNANIQKARRAGFSLMGAGVYGLNGLHIRTNLKIFNSYQMSRLLYGLEVLPLLKGDKDNLDLYHRTTLRYLQHLPPGTSTVAIYIILGQLPPSVTLARNILTLYVNLVRDPDSIECRIIRRQLAMKNNSSKSGVVTVNDLLLEYGLPSAYELLVNPPSKWQWKRTLRHHIIRASLDRLRKEACRKVTLLYLNKDMCAPGTLHPVWNTVRESPQDIIRACAKIRLLTGQYRLHVDIAKQSGGPPTCLLCHESDEDFYHVLLDCKTLCSQRSDFLDKVKPIVSSHEQCTVIFTSRNLMLQLIMDCTMPILLIPMELHDQLESLTRLYTYALHTQRSVLLLGCRANTKPGTVGFS